MASDDGILAALGDEHAELASLLTGLEAPAWDLPSRCEGWTVSDVVLHLAQTDELAVASISGRFGERVQALAGGDEPGSSVDDGAARLVARERGQPSDAVYLRWLTGTEELRKAISGADLHQRVTWVAGPVSVQTLATTRLAETWIHSGDIAAAVGIELRPTNRLRHIARLAWRTLPYAFARAERWLSGPVAFELRGPRGDPWTFVPDAQPVTTIRGDAAELCLVAGRRLDPAATALHGDGPDAAAVLELVRTYA